MISEAVLKEWETHLYEVPFDIENVVELIAEVRRLEKEADYLAEIVASIHGCCVDGVEGDCDKKPDPFYEIPCVRCWREYARKAVKNAEQGKE